METVPKLSEEKDIKVLSCLRPNEEENLIEDSKDFEVIDAGSMTIWIRKGSVEIPEIPQVKKYIYGM